MSLTTKVFFPNDDPKAEFPYRKAVIRPADLDFFLGLGAVKDELEATAMSQDLQAKKEPAKKVEAKPPVKKTSKD